MTSILLAALSALVWGTADYCGGRATRRADALVVTGVSQVLGLPVLIVCVLLLPGVLLASDIAWSVGAGAAGLAGLVLLYRGLATGMMAVVAPITAVTGAVVPMIAGLLLEAWPSALALIGAVCAVIAIALVSLGPTHNGGRVTAGIVGLSLASGAFFGVFFILLAQTSDGSGMWPLLVARCTSVPIALLLAVRRPGGLRFDRPLLPWLAAAGTFDVGANALYLLASREGLLSVVAPISALYPVSTVLLALWIDKERVRRVQIAGLGLAAAALVLTAV